MKPLSVFIKPILFTIVLLLAVVLFVTSNAKDKEVPEVKDLKTSIITGAERIDNYLPLLKGKRVAIMAILQR